MKELDDSARVWRVFNDESERTDAELVDGWTGTLDTLFIFAGLFSAVVSTFLTQTSQNLQQDYSAVTASLLTEMVWLQRVTAIGGNISAVPQSNLTYNSVPVSSSRDVWLNSLRIASLSLTLFVALMAGLVKQWLHYYLADITRATPKVRACVRQFRYRGLIQWGVPPIIESLPILMNTSLLLFFIGLALFTQDLSDAVGIRWFLIGLTAISFTIYVGSGFIPVWKPQCPYKSSLSKVYNGFIKIIWYLAERLSIEDAEQESLAPSRSLRTEEEARSLIKLCSIQFRRWIVDVLSRGSSLRTAESEIVENQGFMLQQDIITEMGLNSTNISVSVIALQSLSAFQVDRDSLQLPESLFEKLGDLFRGCFQRDSLKEWLYSLTSDSSVAERYSRAMLLFPNYISYLDWYRLLSFSPPESIRAAILLASTKKLIQHEDLEVLKNKILDIRFILEVPPIEAFRLIPWGHHQFLGAIDVAVSSDLYSADEQEQLLVALVKRLSPQKALTLQEEVLMHYLYSSRTKAGLIEPLKERTLTEEAKPEMSNDVKMRSLSTFFRFTRLLPDIYDCTFSLESEEQDRLLLYLLGMRFSGWRGAIDMNWDTQWIYLFDDHPEFSSIVDSLMKLLNQLASSWKKWNGDVFIWLKAITKLYGALRYYGECDKEVTHTMFHWLLVLSLQGRDCPGNANPNERAEMEYDLLESLFPDQDSIELTSQDRLDGSLKTICDFVVSKHLLGFPSIVFEHLFEHLGYLLEGSNESTVFDCIDLLFRHFLRQDPLRVDPEYPMTYEAQQTSINHLIKFVCKQCFRSTKWEALLISWRKLINNKNAEPNCIGEGFGAGKVAPRKTYDWIDTTDSRGIMRMFEEGGKTSTWNEDPWDLRDVFWMFENDISLGAPLNLGWLRQQIDKALGLRGGAESHRNLDLAELFESAPNDLFPLTNDQGSRQQRKYKIYSHVSVGL